MIKTVQAELLRGKTTTLIEPPSFTSYDFGNFRIPRTLVCFERDCTYAFLAPNPILPGHLVLCPKANVARFSDLK